MMPAILTKKVRQPAFFFFQREIFIARIIIFQYINNSATMNIINRASPLWRYNCTRCAMADK